MYRSETLAAARALSIGETLPAAQSGRRHTLSAAFVVLLAVVLVAAWFAQRDLFSIASARVSSGSSAEPVERVTTEAPAEQANSDVIRTLAPTVGAQSVHSADEAWDRMLADSPAGKPIQPLITPILLKQVEPVYPAAAKAAGVEGTVVVTYLLDSKGKPRDLQVTQSVAMLDQAVLDALRQWEYSPPSEAAASQRYRHHAEFILDQ